MTANSDYTQACARCGSLAGPNDIFCGGVEDPCLQGSETFDAVLGALHLHVVLFEEAREQLVEANVVVDEQDPAGHGATVVPSRPNGTGAAPGAGAAGKTTAAGGATAGTAGTITGPATVPGANGSRSAVVSTVGGTVVEGRITQGQVVQPADALYVVADLSEVWVTAEVPEQQAALVRTGQAVDIEVPALGVRLTGKLIYVADTVNPETRTVTVRSRVNNAERQLKPAMLATMLIQAAAVERIVVPAEAVVREADADHVFVETAERTYRLTPVRLGPESGGQRPVLDGLKAGQRIVAAGAFHLNTERKRKELE